MATSAKWFVLDNPSVLFLYIQAGDLQRLCLDLFTWVHQGGGMELVLEGGLQVGR